MVRAFLRALCGGVFSRQLLTSLRDTLKPRKEPALRICKPIPVSSDLSVCICVNPWFEPFSALSAVESFRDSFSRPSGTPRNHEKNRRCEYVNPYPYPLIYPCASTPLRSFIRGSSLSLDKFGYVEAQDGNRRPGAGCVFGAIWDGFAGVDFRVIHAYTLAE